MVTQTTENKIRGENTTTRPPIVVVLGHVDHGKSTLLEAIREGVSITSKEAGGMTQHIGAYQAEHQGRKITFLDTPGHELFSAIRARGAKAADIAVLAVAADESVKPQTKEAIEQIAKARIPFVVAITKTDKPEANPQRVKQELGQHGVQVEEHGGKVPCVETSATTKKGIRELLEMILLVAELEDLRADLEKPGQGVIIESLLDAKRGPSATLLVTNGRVRVGDLIATRTAEGKIRILEDFLGNALQTALPSAPAAALGFQSAPRIGDSFFVFENEEARKNYAGAQALPEQHEAGAVLDSKIKPVNIIVKADTAGSLEAIEDVIRTLAADEAVPRVLEAGVGDISENDVKFARAGKAAILGFRVKGSAAALDLAQKENLALHTFDVIYEFIQRVRALLERAQAKEPEQKIGVLGVLAVFLVNKKRQVVGGKVLEGEMRKGAKGEIVRAGEVVGRAKVQNLQLNKKDVVIVPEGKECGVSLETADSVRQGDELRFSFSENK